MFLENWAGHHVTPVSHILSLQCIYGAYLFRTHVNGLEQRFSIPVHVYEVTCQNLVFWHNSVFSSVEALLVRCLKRLGVCVQTNVAYFTAPFRRCNHILELWRIKKGKVNLLKWSSNVFSGKSYLNCIGTSWPSHCSDLINTFVSYYLLRSCRLWQNSITMLLSLERLFYSLTSFPQVAIPFKTGCCSHYIALLYFWKVLTANRRLIPLHLLANADSHPHLASVNFRPCVCVCMYVCIIHTK